jgi:DNA-binding CsgD family transcriptional regulator
MGGKGSGARARPIVSGCLEEVWRRYKAGDAIVGISQAVGHSRAVVYRLLRARGGIAPAPRRRSARVLSLSEREEISRGLATGLSLRAIARGLKRAACTVSQEVGPPWGGLTKRGAGGPTSLSGR